MLPAIRSSSEVVGETDRDWFGASIPIAGIAGDQQAATFGQACHDMGAAKNTYGTGAFLMMHTGRRRVPSTAGLLTTIAWQIEGEPAEYALEGSIFVAGAAVQWLRDGLGIIGTAAETEALALSLPSNEGVYFVPALTGLGAPHWDPHARGLLIGLTRGTTRAHLARAALESMTYQTADVVTAMARDAGVTLKSEHPLRADGGAAVNAFLMQFQADVLGVPVEVPRVTETTALGAAYLAGLTTGFWRDRAELTARWQLARRYEPRLGDDERRRLIARWLRAVERAKGWTPARSEADGGDQRVGLVRCHGKALGSRLSAPAACTHTSPRASCGIRLSTIPSYCHPIGETMGEKLDVKQGTLSLMILRTLEVLGPLHGYGVARRIEETSRHRLTLNYGTLYPALLKLEQEGFVTAEWRPSENNRRAKFYSLTASGRKQLAREAREWHRTADLIAAFLAPRAEEP